MNLPDGYKLLYEFIKENKKSIFAAKALPDFENDAEVSFGDADLEGIKLVYMKDGSIYVSKKNVVTEDDQKVLVYAGDDLIIGVED